VKDYPISPIHVFSKVFAPKPTVVGFVPLVRLTVPLGQSAIVSLIQLVQSAGPPPSLIPELLWKARRIDAHADIVTEANGAQDVPLTPDGAATSYAPSIGPVFRNVFVPENTRLIWGATWDPAGTNATGIGGGIIGHMWESGTLSNSEILQLLQTGSI
jgi:hypothetical protein